ncbi:MAG: zinc-dependent alcohol dehydrogenase [Anaerolineae bacterium]
MKALYTTGPRQYGLVERPLPVPGPTDALVKVLRAGLCHTDVNIREGTAGHVRYPFIPGHEFAGVVAECGSGVANVAVGDRVAVHHAITCGYCLPCRRGDTMSCENYTELGATRDGGFAEYCVAPARHLYKLPDHLSVDEGALLEPLANAVSAVGRARLSLGERVVVIGPGPIGLLVLQVARLAHPSALVLVGTRDERLALGAQLGATHTINATKPGAHDELDAVLGGKGADVVLVCAGTRRALESAMEIVAFRGRIVMEATLGPDETVAIRPSYLLERQGASLLGVNGWVTAEYVQALDLLSRGLVAVKPLVTHQMPLDEWEAAFDLITACKSEAVKVEFAFE